MYGFRSVECLSVEQGHGWEISIFPEMIAYFYLAWCGLAVLYLCDHTQGCIQTNATVCGVGVRVWRVCME